MTLEKLRQLRGDLINLQEAGCTTLVRKCSSNEPAMACEFERLTLLCGVISRVNTEIAALDRMTIVDFEFTKAEKALMSNNT